MNGSPTSPPAEIGMSLDEVDTPALLLDLDLFEANLARMRDALRDRGVRLRPHAKSHKCPEIALRQIAYGAVGVCCQKTSEAEVFVRAGVKDVLVSNEVIGERKLARLARIAGEARVGVCVDALEGVAALRAATERAGTTLDVYVEVNVGSNRCGVAPGEPTAQLAAAIAASRSLRFAGLHAYFGSAQHMRAPDQRSKCIAEASAKLRDTLTLLQARGTPAAIVTGGGTGTFLHEATSGVYNEIQPGSYIFMDVDYSKNLGDDGLPVHQFEQSLFILATVMSHPSPQRGVVDVGLKAHSVDSGMPLVHDLPGVTYLKAADEHGVLTVAEGASLRLGQKIRLIPGHCDPTVNLYDWMVCIRRGRVEALWPISARGAFY